MSRHIRLPKEVWDPQSLLLFISTPCLVPLRAEGLRLPEIEAAILQVLAVGQRACVDEGWLTSALRSDLKQSAVAKWADRFSEQFEFTWERRPLSQDLLFSLTPTEDGGVTPAPDAVKTESLEPLPTH